MSSRRTRAPLAGRNHSLCWRSSSRRRFRTERRALPFIICAQSRERVHATGAPRGQIGSQPCRDAEHERRTGQGDRIERPDAEEQRREEACREQRRGHTDRAADQHQSHGRASRAAAQRRRRRPRAPCGSRPRGCASPRCSAPSRTPRRPPAPCPSPQTPRAGRRLSATAVATSPDAAPSSSTASTRRSGSTSWPAATSAGDIRAGSVAVRTTKLSRRQRRHPAYRSRRRRREELPRAIAR